MLPHRVRNVLLTLTRGRCSRAAASDPDPSSPDPGCDPLQLFADRFYICPGESNVQLFRRGLSCRYGPLGTELRRNVLEQWWHAVVGAGSGSGSGARVFGIGSLQGGRGPLSITEPGRVRRTLLQHEELSREQLEHELQMLLHEAPAVRSSLLQGALEQFIPSLEMVNRKLPFGLAETGVCFQTSEGSGCPVEVNQTSLVWFCSPRTSSQWLDHWARQRLKWWRKFALSPSEFSSSDVPVEEVEQAASRGVRITYNFPWGREPLETLWSRGDSELLEAHQGVRSKLQCRDGHKSVPHVVSVTGNVDRALLAFLSNSLQQLRREGAKQKLQQRKVLKLHPVLTPVKVALDIGRGATVELRQVCEGLLQEFMEAKISTWPGYLDTLPSSAQQLNAKYDEMGVLFSVGVSEDTLESGLVQVRSRDTTIKETMHISEIKNFVSRYISAADNT